MVGKTVVVRGFVVVCCMEVVGRTVVVGKTVVVRSSVVVGCMVVVS